MCLGCLEMLECTVQESDLKVSYDVALKLTIVFILFASSVLYSYLLHKSMVIHAFEHEIFKRYCILV